MKLLVLFMIAICQLSDHRERVQLRAGSRFAYVPSSSLFDLARSLVLSIFIYGTSYYFLFFAYSVQSLLRHILPSFLIYTAYNLPVAQRTLLAASSCPPSQPLRTPTATLSLL